MSQSQVYKWCWDQKKKYTKREDSKKTYLEKRKLIRKELGYRSKEQKYEEESFNFEEKEISPQHIQTKPKVSQRIEENSETEKKVKKRLIFS